MTEFSAPIGILCLDTHFAKPPGHIRCSDSLPFPTRKAVVEGTTIRELLERPSIEFFAPFLDAARDLEGQGCSAITGSCGFMALFQNELANSVSIPVFSSSLIQIPLLHSMSGGHGKIGVITAQKSALTDRHLDAVGAGDTPVVIAGMENQPEFSAVILRNERLEINEKLLSDELIATGKSLLDNHPDITSVVLECTDLPPYASALQEAIQRPVADLTTLATMVHNIVTRRPYSGQVRFD